MNTVWPGFVVHQVEGLHGGEGSEWDGRRFLQGEVIGDVSQCAGVHGRKLGERADLAQRHASVDAVTDRKTGHVRADLLDDAGKLVTHDEGGECRG